MSYRALFKDLLQELAADERPSLISHVLECRTDLQAVIVIAKEQSWPMLLLLVDQSDAADKPGRALLRSSLQQQDTKIIARELVEVMRWNYAE